MANDRFDQGMAMRKSVLGAEHVARAEADQTDFDTDFPAHHNGECMGNYLDTAGDR